MRLKKRKLTHECICAWTIFCFLFQSKSRTAEFNVLCTIVSADAFFRHSASFVVLEVCARLTYLRLRNDTLRCTIIEFSPFCTDAFVHKFRHVLGNVFGCWPGWNFAVAVCKITIVIFVVNTDLFFQTQQMDSSIARTFNTLKKSGFYLAKFHIIEKQCEQPGMR